MNIHQARLDLAAILNVIMPTGWQATTETFPEIHTGLVQVGHAIEVAPLSYTKYTAELAVILWVNESDSGVGVTQLYSLVSPGDDSIWGRLKGTVAVPDTARTLAFGPLTASNVGPRDEGPTGFLAADLTVTVQV